MSTHYHVSWLHGWTNKADGPRVLSHSSQLMNQFVILLKQHLYSSCCSSTSSPLDTSIRRIINNLIVWPLPHSYPGRNRLPASNNLLPIAPCLTQLFRHLPHLILALADISPKHLVNCPEVSPTDHLVVQRPQIIFCPFLFNIAMFCSMFRRRKGSGRLGRAVNPSYKLILHGRDDPIVGERELAVHVLTLASSLPPFRISVDKNRLYKTDSLN